MLTRSSPTSGQALLLPPSSHTAGWRGPDSSPAPTAGSRPGRLSAPPGVTRSEGPAEAGTPYHPGGWPVVTAHSVCRSPRDAEVGAPFSAASSQTCGQTLGSRIRG
ncbi:hypothetical protein VULLAG_LOCUS170 [Vulpes lagopus]